MEIREQLALFEYAGRHQEETNSGALKTKQRRFGAYYTPRSATDVMAKWVMRHDGETVLEPSFGDGAFIRALSRATVSAGFRDLRVLGVELDEGASLKLGKVADGLVLDTIRGDFLQTDSGSVDGVIGNPPYVRLRHLEADSRAHALHVAQQALGHKMATSGSLWMPFVLHAMENLKPGGRLALVLPYEFTYVKYALPLWRKLARSFRFLAVDRSRERLFSDVMQEVVILYADGYGGTTDTVHFRAFETVADLIASQPVIERDLPIRAILDGDRVFVRALLSDTLLRLLDHLLPVRTQRMESLATIRIGYVSGDKGFFHPDPGTVRDYALRPVSLVEAITSTKSLASAGVYSSTVPPGKVSRLFLPQAGLTPSEAAYVEYGESLGVQRRYKCRIRSPWYLVPGVRTPDLILSVFSERPLVLLNDAAFAASNSLICGYTKPGVDSEALVAAWYTSLTLLQCEIEVHALGGGVMVLIPGEANKIRLPYSVQVDEQHLAKLNGLLLATETAKAYMAGDAAVLQEQLGLTSSDIECIREGIEVLAAWRTAHRS
ncbi:MAG: N-6 DNA methylase [Bacteroidota bacterium]